LWHGSTGRQHEQLRYEALVVALTAVTHPQDEAFTVLLVIVTMLVAFSEQVHTKDQVFVVVLVTFVQTQELLLQATGTTGLVVLVLFVVLIGLVRSSLDTQQLQLRVALVELTQAHEVPFKVRFLALVALAGVGLHVQLRDHFLVVVLVTLTHLQAVALLHGAVTLTVPLLVDP
jgi:hypothetical protein